MDDLLTGVYDLHFHTSPDVSPRKCSDLELAERWKAAGMKGGVIKGHYADTTGRASVLMELYPELKICSGLTLNRQAGGLNPSAVERTAQSGGRFLWFPTLDSLEYQKFHHGGESRGNLSNFISVCDSDGKLLPEASEILDVVKEYGLILCTGHIGAKEGLPLLQEAARRGIEKMVVTHADNPATYFDLEEQKECARLGAMIEHSFFTVFYGRTSWDTMVRQIQEIGGSQIILTTDFGQVDSPHSDEGMLQFANGLRKKGISDLELKQMMRVNPAILLG